jgi:hypothetical protein
LQHLSDFIQFVRQIPRVGGQVLAESRKGSGDLDEKIYFRMKKGRQTPPADGYRRFSLGILNTLRRMGERRVGARRTTIFMVSTCLSEDCFRHQYMRLPADGVHGLDFSGGICYNEEDPASF